MTPRFCVECGAPFEAEASFCAECGHRAGSAPIGAGPLVSGTRPEAAGREGTAAPGSDDVDDGGASAGAAPHDAASSRRRGARLVLALMAALALVAGGVAVGLVLADDDDSSVSQTSPGGAPSRNGPTDGVGVTCDTAEGAAQNVFAAWKSNDRAGASGCGADAAVTQLFSLPRSADMLEVTFQSCTAVSATSENCLFADVDGGFVAMGVTGSGNGWTVQWVTGHPD